MKEDFKVIILEDLDFEWTNEEMTKVIKMWKENKGLKEIIESIKREGDEVFLLLMHLARKGRINQRVNGIFGT